MALETELKLALRKEVEKQIAARLSLEPAGGDQHEVTTYFDTPDEALARNGVSLRVRRAGSKRIQTVKVGGENSIAAQRGEWEWPIGSDEPDVQLLRGTPAADRIPPDGLGALQPIVVTDIVRRKRELELDHGTVVEASLDHGHVAAAGTHEPVRELELEIKKGHTASLYRLAMRLHAETPMSIEPESKFARGYRLKTKRPPEPTKAGASIDDPHLRAPDALRQIVTAELGHLTAN